MPKRTRFHRAPPRADTAERPRCFPWARPLPTANGPGHHRERCRGITANSPSPRASVLSAGPGASHRRTALVLSAGPGASHRRTAPVLSTGPGAFHREQPQSASPGAFRGPRRFPSRTAPVLSASTRPRIILLSLAIPLNPAPLHLRRLVEPCHSPEPCSSTPAPTR